MNEKEEIMEAGLKVDALFWETTNENIMSAWNGIGPEWLSNAIRKSITKALEFYRLVFVIHDFDFKYCVDRTRKSFNISNDRALKNMEILRDKLPWYAFLSKYLLKRAAKTLYYFCDEHGWSAWQEGNK